MNANTIATTKTTSAPTASLLCTNRRNACWVWLRDLTVNSRSTGLGVTTGGASTCCCGAAVMGLSPSTRGSAQPDARIQHRVQQVGDEVEQHDEERADDQP